MIKINKSYSRYFVIFIGLVLVFQTVAITTGGTVNKDRVTANQLQNNDLRIADEISNMTGIKAADIIKLKKEGKTWNEILELIKSDPGDKKQDDASIRNKILIESGLGIEEVEKLKSEGFTDDEIMEAKSLVERVIFQLGEITQDNRAIQDTAVPGIIVGQADTAKADTKEYEELSAHIDLNKAITALLRIKKQFDSIYDAMDEYLCALQLELNIEDLVTDKNKYEKIKQDKMLAKGVQDLITMSKIEDTLLTKMQDGNKEMTSIDTAVPSISSGVTPSEIENNPVPLPETELKDIKPKNPTEEIMNEINGITGKNTGTEGR